MRMFQACLLAAVLLAGVRATAQETQFAQGSIIIPMDVDYQNAGMLKSFGLVYRLRLAGVPVDWCIATNKSLYLGTTNALAPNAAAPSSTVDFTASAVDTRTAAVITAHGYRGGPFVVSAAYGATAMPIVNAWTTSNQSVAVHQA